MNQAQFTGERMLRDDPGWSPLAEPFADVGAELVAVSMMNGARARGVLLALGTFATPPSFTELRIAYGDITKDDLYAALRDLAAAGQVVHERSGYGFRYALPKGRS